MTKTFAFSYISVTWLKSAIIAAVYSFAETNQKFFSWIYCKTLLLATIFMYSYILRVAHAQRIRIVAMLHRDNEDRFSKQTPDCLEDKAAKTLKESKASKTFAIVVGAFVVTWIPLIFYPSIAPWSESWYYEGFEWAKTFSLWNSFLNRYIYITGDIGKRPCKCSKLFSAGHVSLLTSLKSAWKYMEKQHLTTDLLLPLISYKLFHLV